ncbi:alanine--tRNA ligase [Bacteroidota bacterium]
MQSNQIRKFFLDYFESNQHKIIHSAPMVVKNDPTLMFVNAGMNQFKNYFLGNKKSADPRIANSQKCLRVSGKHNDLEEVGRDTYHHTMFEMLGNWSFGDYFKKEAIDMAWDLLVTKLGIDPDRLYATIFEGSEDDGIAEDGEAKKFWLKYLDKDRILNGSKKDNFWEMGDTGPCGPCSEIHIDIRDEKERKKLDGKELINKDHPLVIEIWNLVFIQYNRKSNKELESLPEKHVDTGLGFERLCMVLQNKKSNYDTDVFQPLLKEISKIAGIDYGNEEKTDIAMRVIADHLRAISFSIADGQLPSNTGAGYVIRRILRRAVRYGYTFLDMKEAFFGKLLPVLIQTMGEAYPELKKQKDLINKVITEEENAFLRTLETGIKLLDKIIKKAKDNKINQIEGKVVFELYDTYGFPYDLTQLILFEHKLDINKKNFDIELEAQKNRSRSAASTETGDWNIILENKDEDFIGYDNTEAKVKITRYRKVKVKNKIFYQLVFDKSPFYPEGGGQVGDKGYIKNEKEKIIITDTKKENDLMVHFCSRLPSDPSSEFLALVDNDIREKTAVHHSVTHLLHQTLREVLGNHIEQKGSLVAEDHMRFDFSHFQKISSEEIEKIEESVNEKIRANIILEDFRNIQLKEANEMGAIALFGEKYGEQVRVIKFGNSIELCGGTHISATGKIGLFKIVSESSIASGIRRIEAFAGINAIKYVWQQLNILNDITEICKFPKDIKQTVKGIINENVRLKKELTAFDKERLKSLRKFLLEQAVHKNGMNIIALKIDAKSPDELKELSFQLKAELEKYLIILGAEINNKASLSIMIDEKLVKEKGIDANKLIREVSGEIKGGGGGQPFFATAGGKNPEGIDAAINKALKLLD